MNELYLFNLFQRFSIFKVFRYFILCTKYDISGCHGNSKTVRRLWCHYESVSLFVFLYSRYFVIFFFQVSKLNKNEYIIFFCDMGYYEISLYDLSSLFRQTHKKIFICSQYAHDVVLTSYGRQNNCVRTGL